MVKIMYRQLLGEEISVVKIAWTPLDEKFIKANAVTDPMETHGDGFGFANSKTVSSDAFNTFVIGDDRCSLLRVTQSSKDSAFPSGSSAVNVQGSVFGFGYGTKFFVLQMNEIFSVAKMDFME